MYIPDRVEKPESEKKIKQIMMYIILLEEGSVYDFELGLHCENSSDKRKFQRYAKELYDAGAVPKLKLKSEKTIESGKVLNVLHYYEAPSVKLKFAQDPNRTTYLKEIGKEIPLVDINKPLFKNEFSTPLKFHFDKNSKTSFRLARMLFMIYFNRCYSDIIYKDGSSRFRSFYFGYLYPGASEKTYKRDNDLYLYAVFTAKKEIEEIRSKYKDYIKKIRKED